jgi:hypothetical protein
METDAAKLARLIAGLDEKRYRIVIPDLAALAEKREDLRLRRG